ncbi:MAG: 50S ribosomal protein L35ae [Candidatus Njordarchaeales archaeon]
MSAKVIGLEGVIVNFRIGNKSPRWRQIIVRFDNLPPGIKPDNLIGRIVEIRWKNKVFKGRIYKKHGRKGLRVVLQKGLPGQALGNAKVVIVK